MVSPTDHPDMDIGEETLNEAAFIQLISAQVSVAAMMMGSDFAFGALSWVLSRRPELEAYIEHQRRAMKEQGGHDESG